MRWRGGCPIAAPLLWLSGRASTAAAAVDEDEEGGEGANVAIADEIIPSVIEKRSSSSLSSSSSAQERARAEAEANAVAGSELEIAWQYRRYIAAHRALDDRDGGALGGSVHGRAPASQGGSGAGRGLASVRWRQRTSGGGRGSSSGVSSTSGAEVDTPAPRRRAAVAHALDMTRGIGVDAAAALPAAFAPVFGAEAPQRAVDEVLAFFKARCGAGAVPGRVPRVVLESPGGFTSLSQANSMRLDASVDWARTERAWMMVRCVQSSTSPGD